MVLKNNFTILIFIIFCPLFVSAEDKKIELNELFAKQAIANIRFLTKDGKFTYYQKRSGTLLFSTNYKVIEMIKGEMTTEYNLFSTRKRKKIAILQNLNLHNFYSLRNRGKVYITNFGESIPHFVGEGVDPRLHLEDNWVSYFDPFSKSIFFEHTTNSALKFSIKINNKINPYFLPTVIMPNENTVLYTDLGENGNYGLLEFKRNLNKSELKFKLENPMQKLEICLSDKNIFLGLFGIHYSKFGSGIFKLPLDFTDISKKESIYSSVDNDPGQIHCDYSHEHIAFIKNTSTNGTITTDIAEIKLSDNTLSMLSSLKTVTTLIDMDGVLLTQDKGRTYIVKGENDYSNVDLLKSKKDLAPPEDKVE